MPVYVPNYKHDIFVSYAHVDNEPLTGAQKGWVTMLINDLKIFLGKKLGSPDAFSLWMDDELRGNATVTPHVIKQLEGAATLVLILSPAYLISQWCHLERSLFLAKVDKNAGCLFIVEHDQVERPAELSDLLGYKFWHLDDTGKPRILGIPKPKPEEFEYYQILDDLARQLADKLKELKAQAKTIPATTSIPMNSKSTEVTPSPRTNSTVASSLVPSATLFLAEVTADLEEYRHEMKRSLEQQGLRILPDKTYSFTTLQQSLDQDLSECHLFVQLLSDKTDHFHYPQFQYERAQAAGLPILQWRDPALSLASIADPTHCALLEGSTVIASDLMEFQTYIIKHLTPQPKPIFELANDALVFVNAAPEDMPLAHQIKDILDTYGIGYSLPLDISVTTKATEIRQYLEQNLLYCDAVIVLYDHTSVVWVNEQLLYCRRMQRRRDQPLKVIAVYNTPSTNKPPLNIKLPNMRILDCPSPQVDTCLPLFLQSLQT